MPKILVSIADDHRLIRDAIKFLLKDNEEIELIHEAEDGEELLEFLQSNEPDVVLMDVNMPKIDGVSLIKMILQKYPDMGIIMLSMHEEPEIIYKCISEGALSYLLKNVGREELLTTIKKTNKGEKFLNPHMSELFNIGLAEERKRKKEALKLSRREKEILHCLSKGLSSKQMADTLFLSTRTVESHRLRLLKKFKAQNAMELVKIVVDKKLLV
ncbi:MAG: response regulator transcription factor [Bacteroidota bacterium]|nr:response regulator transcription factor [Bacteroidota bacterium]